MNRTKAFGLIAVLSTLLLTASIASAHGRSTNARSVKAARMVRTIHAKGVPMAMAAPLRLSADPVPPIMDPTARPSVEPCSYDDDSYEGTSGSSSESSDDDGMMPSPSVVPPPPSGTCSYSDDDSSTGSSMGMDD
jgi:hypothetical protein